MTNQDAINLALEALKYALENDHEYLPDKVVEAWEQAYFVLSTGNADERA